MTNHLILSGIVYKIPIKKISPSGISHCQFMVEHRSIQKEAGFLRQVWCKIPVVISGKQIFEIAQNIKVGAQITVEGFINCHQGRNSLNKIVLHAEHINVIESED